MWPHANYWTDSSTQFKSVLSFKAIPKVPRTEIISPREYYQDVISRRFKSVPCGWNDNVLPTRPYSTSIYLNSQLYSISIYLTTQLYSTSLYLTSRQYSISIYLTIPPDSISIYLTTRLYSASIYLSTWPYFITIYLTTQ